ncbi:MULTISPECIES: hypothetical protein [unclassified Streptomyces]|uniref:hypothetical protein n=1 Tax=unclassified Streptomyces TaxID=2593676 RepID=UPI0022530F8B|nr:MULTISPECIES: hypothetical protein [unclassified Streptomyces]MCX5287152.1 hypothetical protein [Streptomyces sp. NBC_00183]
MTTTTAPAPAPVSAAPRRGALRPRGLVWTVLRLHRTAMFVWLGFVAFTAGFLLWLQGPGANATQAKLDAFGYGGVLDAAYDQGMLLGFTAGAYNNLFYDPGTLISLASFGVALFAAGPLTARELEFGTAQLVWGQSPSPARWLATKLAMPALAVTAGMSLLVVLYRLLWNAHGNLLIAGIGPRAFYFSIGPATVAAPLLGLALGALVGLAVRRTLPALAVAGVGYFLVNSFRGNSWPFQGRYQQPEIHSRSWAVNSKGAVIPDPDCYDNTRCLAQHGVVRFGREYLPSSDYWPRQLLETGVLLGLTALALAAAFLLLRKRSNLV